MQIYTDPKREQLPHTLPNAETFYIDLGNRGEIPPAVTPGWYWRICFPGCLPNSNSHGPFETEKLAITDAQSNEEV